MSAQNAMRLTKTVKKLEKPRPLKAAANQNRHSIVDSRLNTVEDVMALVDAVSMHILNGNYDKVLQANIITLGSNLKVYGSQLETVYKDQLDRAYVVFRNGCRDDRLDVSSRMQLLELIELRATNWLPCDNMNGYYKPKLSNIETEILPAAETPTHVGLTATLVCPTSPPALPPLLAPGEVIKTSGKFAKPTKIPGKNYCKDEVVIRNSDSGKVMGIKGRRVHMIEELSETIISFQRVSPGAKERLVQITGPAEEKINYAKQLMEETIRRNASPVRPEQNERSERVGGSSSSLNSSASDDSSRLPQGMNRSKLLHSFSTNDASLGEYKYTVTVGHHTLKIFGSNLDIVRTAKLLLEDFFSGDPEQYVGTGDFFSTFEDEPVFSSAGVLEAPPAPVNPTAQGPSRVSSLDSAATSESDDTYKPLFPAAPREAFAAAEAAARSTTDVSARNRRALFAITNTQPLQQQAPTTAISSAVDVQQNKHEPNTANVPVLSKVCYSREFLLQLALSSFSAEIPADWEQINADCPAIVKKVQFNDIVYQSYSSNETIR